MDQGQPAPQAQPAAATAPPVLPLPPPALPAAPASPVFALGPGRSHAVLDYDDPSTGATATKLYNKPSRPSKRSSMGKLTTWPSSLQVSTIELAVSIGNTSSWCQSVMEPPGTS